MVWFVSTARLRLVAKARKIFRDVERTTPGRGVGRYRQGGAAVVDY